MFRVGNRQSDLDILEPSEGDDLARAGGWNLDTVQAVEGIEFCDTRLVGFLVRIERQQRNDIADVSRSALDTTDREPPEIRRVVDRGHEHLEWTFGVVRRRGHFLNDGLEQ